MENNKPRSATDEEVDRVILFYLKEEATALTNLPDNIKDLLSIDKTKKYAYDVEKNSDFIIDYARELKGKSAILTYKLECGAKIFSAFFANNSKGKVEFHNDIFFLTTNNRIFHINDWDEVDENTNKKLSETVKTLERNLA